MNKIIYVLILLVALQTACKKDEVELKNQASNPTSPANPTTPAPVDSIILEIENKPSAKVNDDNLSSGIYKGTFVGSSGSFKLTIETDNIYGLLDIDGVGYELTTSDITNSNLGAAITNATFTDIDGVVTLVFSVSANGQNPSVILSITGHTNIEVVVGKETSNNHIKVYEGTSHVYASSASGMETWTTNLLINDADSIAFSTIKFADGTTWSEECSYLIQNDSIEIYHWVEEIPGQWIKEGIYGHDQKMHFTDERISYDYTDWYGTESVQMKRKL